uniref:AAA+ ATPase domain-containing protein n=1 Tax=viral metagenome TaxID=1070528 RepID=A0A6C0LDQ5_9ZZZZ
MSLQIHQTILEKLEYFRKIHKIPNIIFHGPTGCGKRTIVNQFINIIYDNNKEKIKNFVMYVNCAHGKGIKFIREELKFFAKTHIQSNGGDIFKSAVLLNADKLTIDAQSALRRCIELFSHTTRFFIIVEDKYKLLKPILSRFCEIYVGEPVHQGKIINLYKYNLNKTFKWDNVKTGRNDWLKKELLKFISGGKKMVHEDLTHLSIKLYEKGYSGLDIIQLLETSTLFDSYIPMAKRHDLLFAFSKIKKEFRNEKIIIMFMLHFLFLDTEFNLENMSFM